MNRLDDYKKELEIDYFAYFAKAYFAFNYYLKTKMDNTLSDREKINTLKEKNNVCVKFVDLAKNNIFYNNLLGLRNALSSNEIQNEGNVINFDKVQISSYKEEEVCNDEYHTIKYFIKALNNGKVTISCGNIKNITCKIDEVEEELQNQKKISKPQCKRIINIISDYQKNKIININDLIEQIENYKQNLENTKSDSKKVEAANQINSNYEILFKAFIEIIYNLRNALFHSEIDITNQETRLAYEKAYWLLRDFVKKLT